jgi:type IX secretion system PorP/SprF family membrane protein
MPRQKGIFSPGVSNFAPKGGSGKHTAPPHRREVLANTHTARTGRRTVLHDTRRAAAARLCGIMALCLAALPAAAQQDPAFVHYWQMETGFNPAAAGRTPQLAITAAVQTHAMGYEDGGSTMYAGADMAFQIGKTRHGVGLLFQNDAFGLFSHKRFSLQYAYHFRLFGGTLSVGGEADMLNESLKGSKADLATSNDPAFPTTDVSGSKFDATAGLWYAHKRWYAGFGAQHLTSPKIYLGETNEYKVHLLYNFTAGYNIRLRSPLFTICPSVMLRYDGTSFRSDITARLRYAYQKRQLYGGVNYSPQHSVAVFVGGMFHGVDLSYSYEANTSGIGLGAGQHEVTLGYRLDLNLGKKGKNAHRSVRWL